jgi:hypothetical protein
LESTATNSVVWTTYELETETTIQYRAASASLARTSHQFRACALRIGRHSSLLVVPSSTRRGVRARPAGSILRSPGRAERRPAAASRARPAGSILRSPGRSDGRRRRSRARSVAESCTRLRGERRRVAPFCPQIRRPASPHRVPHCLHGRRPPRLPRGGNPFIFLAAGAAAP